MAEQLVSEFTVNRPIAEAWAVITDVERIAPCLPGAQLQEIEGEVFRGVVKIKLGSITPQFKGQATFLDRDDPAYRAVLKAEGRDIGGRGNAKAEITAQAESLSPTSTRCVVTTDLHITGKVAQFGRGIIGDVSKKLMAQFASNLNTMLDDANLDQRSVEDDADTSPPAQGDAAPIDASGSPATDHRADTADTADTGTTANSGPTASPPGDDHTPVGGLRPAGASQSGPSPRVRKIDSPATEPVDLAEVAGPAILKRLAPVIGVLAFVLVLMRRRR